MAEKTDKLEKDTGIMSETDKSIVSLAASSSDDEFVEKYTDDVSRTDETADDPKQIRSQIEKTRREMGETIDEIQERLSYENISEQVSERVTEAFDAAKATAYEATVGKIGDFIKNIGREMKYMGKEISKTETGRTVLSNPVPFALIGLGAGILLVNTFSKNKSSRSGRNYDQDYSPSAKSKSSMLKSAGDKASNAYNSVSETASSAYENVSEYAGSAYDSASGAAGSAYSSINDAAGQAYEKAGELGQQARKQYDYYIEENPLAVGAVALAVGAAVGFAIPSTRYENRMLGDTRDQLMKKANEQVKGLVHSAQETAKDQIDKVKTVAKESVEKARESAKDQDLIH